MSSSNSQPDKAAQASKPSTRRTETQKKSSKKHMPRQQSITNSALSIPSTSGISSSKTSHPYIRRRVDTAKLKIAMELGGVETEQYLVRTNHGSAAQALGFSSVRFNKESRSQQLDRLRDLRADTQPKIFQEIDQCISDLFGERARYESGGLISNGLVVSMTHEEAQKLCKELRNVHLLRNQTLTLISPTLASSILSELPPSAGWHLEAIGQTVARKNGKAFTGAGVRIAVMDTGIDFSHPALRGRVVEMWKIKPDASTIDFHALEKDSAHYDTDGHGTHIAGILCGTNIGVAPEVELVSVTMMPRQIATTFDFVRCLDWAAKHPEVMLINISAGLTPFVPDMLPYVADVISTGALPIMAVGNEGPNNTRSPGNYNDGVSVGSVDPPGTTVSSFSGSGRQVSDQLQYEVPDLVAPGREIFSCYLENKYISMDGTSMATPIVTGIAACLIEQANGLISPLDLTDQLRRSCMHLEKELSIRQGAGLVQVPTKP